MSQQPRPTRRHLLGYAGAGGLGLVAGTAAGATVARQDAAPTVGAPAPVVPGTVPAYGEHQAGITTRTPRTTRLLALDLRPDTDRDALGRLMRLWSGTIAALAQGRPPPGDTARDLAQANTDLTVTVGWGPALFDKTGLEADRPSALAAVPAFTHDRLQARWSGGDLLLMAAAADDTTLNHALRRLLLDAEPFASQRWEQEGSWRGLDADQAPVTGRNLFGQVDGTGNLPPQDPLFDATVWAKTPAWFAGGTTVVVRRIRMDLDAWDGLTRDEQERVIGRDLDQGAPLGATEETDPPDFESTDEAGRLVIPADAHLRLAHPTATGGARIVRRGLNYSTYDPGTRVREAGLVFCSFQADIDTQFTPIQRRLDRGDSLNTWTTAIGSAEFAVLPGFVEGGYLGDTLLG